jgi:hypothetical protein
VRRSVIAQTTEIADESVYQWPAVEEVTNSSEKTERLLAWAVRERVITSLEAWLLAARYCAEDSSRATWKSVGSLTAVAAETGLSLVAARKRCSRAARKIAAIVDAYPGPWSGPVRQGSRGTPLRSRIARRAGSAGQGRAPRPADQHDRPASGWCYG